MWRAFSSLPPALALATVCLTFANPVRLAAACPCLVQFGVCDEAKQSDVIFIGTVEAVYPPFLDPFKRSDAASALPAAEIERLKADNSPEAFAKLKSVYQQMFAGLADSVRSRFADAKTRTALQSAFEEAQAEGRLARFRVRTFFKHSSDDDPTDDDKKESQPAFLDIATPTGDCGIDFQVGETYLVYASQDEGSERLDTSACMRTTRLSSEKGDLAYLYFLQNSPMESARLEGFVSASVADQNLPRYENSITSPAVGSILELDSGSSRRYTQADTDGRFFFDGLAEGDYRVSLLEAGFPRTNRNVLISRSVHVEEGSCPRQVMILPTRSATQLSN